MTVKELKEKLKNAPDNMDVFIEKSDNEFQYSLISKAEIKEIGFYEKGGNKPVVKNNVFLITD